MNITISVFDTNITEPKLSFFRSFTGVYKMLFAVSSLQDVSDFLKLISVLKMPLQLPACPMNNKVTHAFVWQLSQTGDILFEIKDMCYM